MHAKEIKKNEAQNRLSNGRKIIQNECARILKQIELSRQSVWDNATILVELNGPILKHSKLASHADELQTMVGKIEKKTFHVDSIEQLDLYYKETHEATNSLNSLLNKIQSERERRERIEEEARDEFDQRSLDKQTRFAEVEKRKAKQKEQQEREAEEIRRQSLIDSAQTRLADYGKDIQHIMQVQSTAVKAEQFNELQDLMKEREQRERAELEEFESQLFGNNTKTTNSQAEVMQKRTDGVLKSAAKMKAHRLKRNEAKAEAEKKRQQRLKEVKRAKQQAEKIKMEQRIRKREEDEVERLKAVQEARAALDEDEDDTEEEKRARAEARKMLMKYDGDIWTAVKTGNSEMLRRFFLVEGSEELIQRHNYEEGEGGRTLLHAASWYGHRNIVQFLLNLGADANAHDSASSKTTALMEAARAGRREICMDLVRNGADLFLQDAHGDTALHWAARRGWAGIVVGMIQVAEKRSEGSTRSIYSVENQKNRIFLAVAKNQHVHALVKKTFGIVTEERPENDRDPVKKSHRKSNKKKKMGEMNAEELEKALMEGEMNPSEEYQAMATGHVQGLSDLGLNLDSFAYGRR